MTQARVGQASTQRRQVAALDQAVDAALGQDFRQARRGHRVANEVKAHPAPRKRLAAHGGRRA